MTVRVPVNAELLRWACMRNGHEPDVYFEKFRKLEAWLRGDVEPTLKQLESFAKATRTPVGFFFLPGPPEEKVPIPDFRVGTGQSTPRPSPDLLDTVYLCQQRQEWFGEHARATGQRPLEFVGSAHVSDDVVETASRIREALGFTLEARRRSPTWTDALRQFIDLADTFGVLVMCSGVVGSNTSRPLDPAEFRGFAIADELAPLIFINGADTKAAQMFTLAHELAHIWARQSGVSNPEVVRSSTNVVERWCNEVAAELLVPLTVLKEALHDQAEVQGEMERLARFFKVSTLVVLRRLHDVGRLTADEMWEQYRSELERLMELPKTSGGNFYLTQPVRVSKRFARALVVSTLEGNTLYRDAFRMLGVSKTSTFNQLGHSLGVT
jgi:Zn-dependent peptidase ImmA (M78 family)